MLTDFEESPCWGLQVSFSLSLLSVVLRLCVYQPCDSLGRLERGVSLAEMEMEIVTSATSVAIFTYLMPMVLDGSASLVTPTPGSKGLDQLSTAVSRLSSESP